MPVMRSRIKALGFPLSTFESKDTCYPPQRLRGGPRVEYVVDLLLLLHWKILASPQPSRLINLGEEEERQVTLLPLMLFPSNKTLRSSLTSWLKEFLQTCLINEAWSPLAKSWTHPRLLGPKISLLLLKPKFLLLYLLLWLLKLLQLHPIRRKVGESVKRMLGEAQVSGHHLLMQRFPLFKRKLLL